MTGTPWKREQLWQCSRRKVRRHYSNKTKTDAGGEDGGGRKSSAIRWTSFNFQSDFLSSCSHFNRANCAHVTDVCIHHVAHVDPLVGLTSAQVHLCAAALRVAVNPALVHCSRGVNRATVGRVGLGCPHDHPADMGHEKRMGRERSLQLVAGCRKKFAFESHVKLSHLLGNDAKASLVRRVWPFCLKKRKEKRSTHC